MPIPPAEALANVLATQPSKTSSRPDIRAEKGSTGLVNALMRFASQKLDDQGLQRKVGKLLGVDDERTLALKTSSDWQKENKQEDAYGDTLNHILLGGLTTPEGFEPRKALANVLINARERSFVEKPSVEDRIDMNNNDFGTALARQMMTDGTYSPQAFIDIAKRYVTWMTQGNRGMPINGLEPQLSTASGRHKTPRPAK